jgi:hypothetical protein
MKHYSRYERKDPWKQYPWDDETMKMSVLESFVWGLVTGFCLTVIVIVPGPW